MLWEKSTISISSSILQFRTILTNIFVSIRRKRRKANTNEIEITVNRRRIRFSNFPERKQLQSPFVRNHRHDWQLIFSVEIANDSIGSIPSIAQTTRSINSNPSPPKINSRRISSHSPWNEVESRRGEPVRWQAPLKNLANLIALPPLPSPPLLRRLNFRVEISTIAEDLRSWNFNLFFYRTLIRPNFPRVQTLCNDVAAILIVTPPTSSPGLGKRGRCLHA